MVMREDMDRHHLSTNRQTAAPLNGWKNQKIIFYDLRMVNVTLSQTIILNSLDLVIEKGDFIFLTGPTGAGKTTLLKFLNGEIPTFNGEFFTPVLQPESTLFVSKIFQDLKLFESLSVVENFNFCYDKNIYNSREEFDEEVGEYVRILGLKDYLGLSLAKLSGGLKQKVAIVRSLLSRPDILLADEPSSNLDRRSTLQLFEVLNYLNVKKKMTIVWATHNQEVIKNFHGKLIHLEKGRLTYIGQACYT